MDNTTVKTAGDTVVVSPAEMLIKAVYGEPPAGDPELFDIYNAAVEIQKKYMTANEGKEGFKKISLGDYSAEYFDSNSSAASSVISPYAAALLKKVYGELRPAEVVF